MQIGFFFSILKYKEFPWRYTHKIRGSGECFTAGESPAAKDARAGHHLWGRHFCSGKGQKAKEFDIGCGAQKKHCFKHFWNAPSASVSLPQSHTYGAKEPSFQWDHIPPSSTGNLAPSKAWSFWIIKILTDPTGCPRILP